MQFEFATAAKIIFGVGKLDSIGEITAGLGRQSLIVSSGPQLSTDRVVDLLSHSGISAQVHRIHGEPTVDSVQEVVNAVKESSTEFIIGIGGGSTLDTAKAAAALSTNSGNITDFLEVIGQNKPLTKPSLPLVAIPTTAGTGAEVTKNAVIGSPTQRVKVSLRSPYLLPRVALVDPQLTLSVPPEVTAYTGLDTLTQLIEPFTCINPNPITDAICLAGLKSLAGSFLRAYEVGNDLQARENMSFASLSSGLALANAKLGAVHGLAGPIGGEIHAHHGAICARLLPEVMEANISILAGQPAGHAVLNRYETIAKLLSGNPDATIETGIQWVRVLLQHMHIHSLAEFGLNEEYFPGLIEKALRSSSMRGNPITLSEADLRNILQRSLSIPVG